MGGVVEHAVRTQGVPTDNITTENALACPTPYLCCPTSHHMGSSVLRMTRFTQHSIPGLPEEVTMQPLTVFPPTFLAAALPMRINTLVVEGEA